MMKKNVITIAIILILAGVAIYTNFGGKSVSNTERPEVGYKAPNFELASLDSQTYQLDKINKPVLVNFWASWCGPCREEAPSLAKLYKKYGDQVEFLAVDLAVNDPVENVNSFVKHYQYNFPILLDKDGKIADKYKVLGIPTTFFVDQNKQVVKVASGLHTEDEIEQMIQQIIAKK